MELVYMVYVNDSKKCSVLHLSLDKHCFILAMEWGMRVYILENKKLYQDMLPFMCVIGLVLKVTYFV
jgi:hypothetical protein